MENDIQKERLANAKKDSQTVKNSLLGVRTADDLYEDAKGVTSFTVNKTAQVVTGAYHLGQAVEGAVKEQSFEKTLTPEEQSIFKMLNTDEKKSVISGNKTLKETIISKENNGSSNPYQDELKAKAKKKAIAEKAKKAKNANKFQRNSGIKSALKEQQRELIKEGSKGVTQAGRLANVTKKGARLGFKTAKATEKVASKSAKELTKDAVKFKRIQEVLASADNPEEALKMIGQHGIRKGVTFIIRMFRMIFKAMINLLKPLLAPLIPYILVSTVLLVIISSVIADDDDKKKQEQMQQYAAASSSLGGFNVGNLNYVSYAQGRYEYAGEARKWCGITAFADILASYGIESPYSKGKLINPADVVRLQDEKGLAIKSSKGVHQLASGWMTTIATEYNFDFTYILNSSYKGLKVWEWTCQMLNDGWSVVVCFDKNSYFEGGGRITSDRHYVWVVGAVNEGQTKFACINPSNGGADETYLPDTLCDGVLANMIVSKDTFITKTGHTNFMVAYALRPKDYTPESSTED